MLGCLPPRRLLQSCSIASPVTRRLDEVPLAQIDLRRAWVESPRGGWVAVLEIGRGSETVSEG